MTDREIIQHLAEKVMRWRVIALGLTSGIFDSDPGELHGTRHWPDNFNPLESIYDAFEVQSKVLSSEKRRLYTTAIIDYCFDEQVAGGLVSFCLSATPRQRCLAMCKATGAQG